MTLRLLGARPLSFPVARNPARAKRFLRRAAGIAVVRAADSGERNDSTRFRWLDRPWLRGVFHKPQMSPRDSGGEISGPCPMGTPGRADALSTAMERKGHVCTEEGQTQGTGHGFLEVGFSKLLDRLDLGRSGRGSAGSQPCSTPLGEKPGHRRRVRPQLHEGPNPRPPRRRAPPRRSAYRLRMHPQLRRNVLLVDTRE